MSNEEKLNHYIDRLQKSDERSLIIKKHCARLVSKSDNNELLQAMKAARIMKVRSEKVSPDPLFVNQLEHALLSARRETAAALWVFMIPAVATLAVFVLAFVPGEPNAQPLSTFASIELPLEEGLAEQFAVQAAEPMSHARKRVSSSSSSASIEQQNTLETSSITQTTPETPVEPSPPSDTFEEMVHQVNLASF